MKKIQSNNKNICLIAILRDEEPFLDEWILYHKMIGIEHFFLYDDSPELPLKKFLLPHEEYVTVIPWFGESDKFEGVSKQTKAYWHAVQNYAYDYEWGTFIDCDEFIVLRHHKLLPKFISEYKNFSAVSLSWHMFGHNGFFDDPQGLITASLTRRQYLPSRMVKTIVRIKQIEIIQNPHHFSLKSGLWVDPNLKPYGPPYLGKTERAHINHYHCRSFTRWLKRAERGDVAFNEENGPTIWHWKLDKLQCLEKFITTVALDHNEYIDEYMLKYKAPLEEAIKKIKR